MAAFVLSLSAFVTAERNSSTELLKENKIAGNNLSSTQGISSCVKSENDCGQLIVTSVDTKVLINEANSNAVDLQHLIKSYK